jgi:hypothetical protein
MQPMQSLLKIHFAGTELLTGLPEYRNGGLFIDLGVLSLKAEDAKRGLRQYEEHMEKTTGGKGVEVAPMFEPSDDVVVEWRGVTVGFLDRLLVEVNQLLGADLSLPQLLEAGSWKVSDGWIRERLGLYLLLTEVTYRAEERLRRSAGQIRKARPSSLIATVLYSSKSPCLQIMCHDSPSALCKNAVICSSIIYATIT